jgi:hypothetical protein
LAFHDNVRFKSDRQIVEQISGRSVPETQWKYIRKIGLMLDVGEIPSYVPPDLKTSADYFGIDDGVQARPSALQVAWVLPDKNGASPNELAEAIFAPVQAALSTVALSSAVCV